MKVFLFLSFFLISAACFSQDVRSLKKMKPADDFDNIHVEKISEDSLQSSFVIWVKSGVKQHFHAEHTENLYVISGKATMTLADSTFTIRKGDHLTIPMGTPHSVTKVFGRKPLQVLSVQSPLFDGSDRVFIETIQP
ncbi:MAG: cupin domain-containing protein [Crocinitomicaceae bacterium]|nr:cupin domain-containing protein [Crocinitomicaceae bacterium]